MARSGASKIAWLGGAGCFAAAGDGVSEAGGAARIPRPGRRGARADLIALVARDARVHMIGPQPELRHDECGEPCFEGWAVQLGRVSA